MIKEVALQILNLLDLVLYSRKKLTITLIFSKYKLKLLLLTKKKFTRRNCLIIKNCYFATITNDCQRIFDLIEQNKYLKNRIKTLKKLLRTCNENRKELTFVLLILIIYNIITIVKILFSLVVYLRIEITILILLIIDYCNKFTDFEHFVLKI